MKISIVIPTRNGSPFLEYCLKTCVALDDPDLEIIVSDNFSTDNTRQIADGFLSDARVRYYNTGASVSMRSNYEFALSKVTGDYVIFIGDDDGIVVGGLRLLRKVIDEHAPDAINWNVVHYTWPNTLGNGSKEAVKFDFSSAYNKPQFRDSPNILDRFCRAEILKYKAGSNLYHGCLSRKIIDSLRTPDGVFFHAHNPDVYSSLASLTCVKKFIYVHFPVTIGGESKKSTGLAMLGQTQKSDMTAIANSFVSLAESDPVKCELPMEIRSVVAIAYACLCRVNKVVCNNTLPVKHEIWREKIITHVRSLPPEKRLADAEILKNFFLDKDPDWSAQDGPIDLSPIVSPVPDRPFFFRLLSFGKKTVLAVFPYKAMPDVESVARGLDKAITWRYLSDAPLSKHSNFASIWSLFKFRYLS